MQNSNLTNKKLDELTIIETKSVTTGNDGFFSFDLKNNYIPIFVYTHGGSVSNGYNFVSPFLSGEGTTWNSYIKDWLNNYAPVNITLDINIVWLKIGD